MGRREGESKEDRKRRKQEKLERKEKREQKRERKAKRKSLSSLSPNKSPGSKKVKFQQDEGSVSQNDALTTKLEEVKNSPIATSDNSNSDRIRVEAVADDSTDSSQSPFQIKTARLLLSLLPGALNDIDKATHKAMESLLLKYSDGFGGVLLSFENIQMEKDDNASGTNGNSYGRIINEMPHIHFYVTADILVFNPSIGRELIGVVNEAFPSHIGFLVHDLFNAMVSADSLRKVGFAFDPETSDWKNTKSLATVVNGDKMKFNISKLHECNGLISLECENPDLIS
jgi:hypothetical protein